MAEDGATDKVGVKDECTEVRLRSRLRECAAEGRAVGTLAETRA